MSIHPSLGFNWHPFEGLVVVSSTFLLETTTFPPSLPGSQNTEEEWQSKSWSGGYGAGGSLEELGKGSLEGWVTSNHKESLISSWWADCNMFFKISWCQEINHTSRCKPSPSFLKNYDGVVLLRADMCEGKVFQDLCEKSHHSELLSNILWGNPLHFRP